MQKKKKKTLHPTLPHKQALCAFSPTTTVLLGSPACACSYRHPQKVAATGAIPPPSPHRVQSPMILQLLASTFQIAVTATAAFAVPAAQSPRQGVCSGNNPGRGMLVGF